ncbi:MAG TPA: hypothetical protein DCZ69_08675, partial [Syntrophobacteraceae bacterium]|nr:hypothetical protein [Syntrophobacteraceae bacterium]
DPNRVRTIEIEQVRKDGTIFWTEVTARFLYGSSGEPVGIIGATRDISERKHADKALQESEERFRLLFDGAADAFFITDLQGRLVNVNRAACESLGFARDELLQMSVPDIEVGQSPEDMVALWERIGLGHGITVEGVHRRRDGSTFPVEIHIIPFALDESPLMFGVARDITDRKRTQEEMIHLRNYLANIIDSMPSMLVGVDADGHVTQWNAAAESLTGISAVEILGQGLGEVLPSLNHVLEHVHEAVRTRSVRSKSKTPRLVGGKMRYEDITVYPLAGLGMTGAVIRIDDVTEKVKLEEMMIQSEKMLSVGGLAAGMAHEINNPLGVILQASQNVLRRVSPDLPANARIAEACGTTLGAVRNYLEQREISLFLEDIRNSGFRAAQIVENMLDFSRMSDTKGSPTDMVSLLDRAVDLAASDFDLKKGFDFREIEILREVHPDVPLVICQPSKIQQVFLNILRNGAEAMMEARASGRTPRFVLRVLRDDSMVRIEIEDNGPGMDEGMRRRIFEPFFTTKDPGKGIGLGLSVSYFIITEEHGGTLEVESQLETGSRFIIRLPAGGE